MIHGLPDVNMLNLPSVEKQNLPVSHLARTAPVQWKLRADDIWRAEEQRIGRNYEEKLFQMDKMDLIEDDNIFTFSVRYDSTDDTKVSHLTFKPVTQLCIVNDNFCPGALHQLSVSHVLLSYCTKPVLKPVLYVALDNFKFDSIPFYHFFKSFFFSQK